MKSKMSTALVGLGMGMGGAMLYHNLKNGSMKKMVRKMNSTKTKAIDNLENMI